MATDPGGLRVEYADLGTLVRAPRNPKQHDLGALHASLDRFGFVAPILVDDASGRIVAGHGRLDALQQLKASGAPAPDRVRVAGDRWLVPVIRGVAFASPVEAESYLVADNQTTILGGWDSARLAELLSDLAAQQALAGTGFDQDAVDELLRDVAAASAHDAADPPARIVDGGHSTQKPLECMARPIRNHAGDVYDPFLGSGTTLVAAEQLGRRGYGLEIEPGYVAVILQRLSEMGLEPRLLDG